MVSAPAADPGVPSGWWRHVQTPHATSQRLLKLNGRRRKDRLWRLNDDNTVAVETKRRTTGFRCVSRGTRLKHERDIAQRFVEKKQQKVDANREQGVSDRHCYDKSGVPNLGTCTHNGTFKVINRGETHLCNIYFQIFIHISVNIIFQ